MRLSTRQRRVLALLSRARERGALIGAFVLLSLLASSVTGQGNINQASPLDRHRITALPGAQEFKERTDEFHSVGSDGALQIRLPLHQIAGPVPIDLDLTYRSGIKVDQQASWVGLGWDMASWSIRRVAVHGDDPSCFDQNVQNSRNEINDIFVASIPGRSIKFINTGTMANPIFTPLSYSNDSLYSDMYLNTATATWDFWEHDYFVLVDENGTRYVFGQPLKHMTMQPPNADHVFYSWQGNWTIPIFVNAEWLLTAILSHDYIDGGGDPLDPLDCTYPKTDNAGDWATFVYSGFCGEGQVEYSTDTIPVGVVSEPSATYPSNYYVDTTEIAYLRKIVTPTSVVSFRLTPLDRRSTLFYLSSGSMESVRQRNAMLSQMHVQAYSGDSTLATGPTLYTCTFNYELHGTESLKERYFSSIYGQLLIMGEPALQRVTIGTMNNYYGAAAREWDTCGYEKKYEFTYDELTDNYVNNYGSKMAFWQDRAEWARGGPLNDDTTANVDNQSWADRMSDRDWGHRDYFGYLFQYPQMWSINSMTLAEGLEFTYEYEPNQFQLGGATWTSGGCRVKRIISDGDYAAEDTSLFIYGANGNGIGHVTAMPFTYERAKMVRQIWYKIAGCGGRPVPEYVLHFKSDHVDHAIHYPEIMRQLSGNRGSVTDYYITADSTGGHRMRKMSYEQDETLCPDTSFCWETVCFATEFHMNAHAFYAFYQDRSPLLGIPYKHVVLDQGGAELSFWQRYYSYIPVTADTIVADGLTSFGPAEGSTPFTLGDTVQASYFVQLDSLIQRADGVQTKSYYAYDHLYRVDEVTAVFNDHCQRTEYTYASSQVSTMRNRHYLAPLAVEKVYRLTAADGVPTLWNQVTTSYRSDFRSQNQSGQNTIWYPSAKSTWADYDEDHVVVPGELLTTTVEDVASDGRPLTLVDARGIRTAYVYTTEGVEASFEGVAGADYGIMTAEEPVQQQPLSAYGQPFLVMIDGIDSTVAFTGQVSAKQVNLSGGTVYGPAGMFSDANVTGTYIAECWARCTAPNILRLTMAARCNDQHAITLKTVPVANEWHRLVCTLYVPEVDSLRVYGVLGGIGTGWFDDLRVYPATALVASATYDGMGRVTTASDAGNIPTRIYYSQYNEVSATADYLRRPTSGAERFYASTCKFANYEPNLRLDLQSREGGFIDDFSTNTLNDYTVTGNGPLYWDQDNQQLHFQHIPIGDFYNNVEIPVEEFEDGLVFLDARSASWWLKDAGTTSDHTYANLWFGFEDDANQGYAVSFAYDWSLSILKYNGENYENLSVVAQRDDGPSYPSFEKLLKHRFGFGKIGSHLFVFFNGDCVFHTQDNSIGSFNALKLKFKSAYADTPEQDVWVDNLTLYADPVATAEFINRYGKVKQRQVFDGSGIQVAAFKNTSDGLDQAQFKPISCSPNIDYIYGQWPKYWTTHRSPFDLILGVVDDDEMLNWNPGDDISTGGLLYGYYNASGTADCFGADGKMYPYTETVYDADPLRRVSEIRSPGVYRAHPTQVDYGKSQSTLPGFDATHYPTGSVFRQRKVDEDGNVTVNFLDKTGLLIATVGDSITNGVSTYTRHHRDFWGNDTLVVQPLGHTIRKVYDNLGQVLIDSSGDYGKRSYLYDQRGNLRFRATATDLVNLRFHYSKYDEHSRPIEEGVYSGLTAFHRTNAHNAEFPTSGDPHVVVLAEYTYDEGEFGRGRLTRAVKYPSGKPDSASWEEYRYDEYGNLVEKKQFVHLVDSVGPRVTTAEYDLAGNLTRLTYHDGTIIDYGYDLMGQVTSVSDTAGQFGVDFTYWASGLVREQSCWWPSASPDPINAQTVDYSYNCRDWLETINYGDVSSSTYGTGDHISLQLMYDSGAYRGMCLLDSCEHPAGYYNGNISKSVLRASPGVGADSLVQQFAYDGLDRLIAVDYTGVNSPHDETYEYDANGRIACIRDDMGTAVNSYGYVSGKNQLNYATRYNDTTWFAYNRSGAVLSYDGDKPRHGYNLDERLASRKRRGQYDPPDGSDTAGVQMWYNHEGDRIALRRHYYYGYVCDEPGVPDDPIQPISAYPVVPEDGPNNLTAPPATFASWRTPELMPSLSLWRHEPPARRCLPNLHWLVGDIGGGPSRTSYCTTAVTSIRGFYYFGGNLLMEYEGPKAGDLQANYVYANGKRIVQLGRNPEDVRFILTDHLGSTVGVVDRQGTLRNRYQYQPYGGLHRAIVNDYNRLMYTGQHYDDGIAPAVYYYRARYYDPGLGVVLSVDPQADRYPAWSPYAYTLDNPVRYVDPSGEWLETAWDAFNVSLDIKFLVEDWKAGDYWGVAADVGGLVVDMVATAAPVVPAGVGAIRQSARAAKTASAAVDATKAADAAVEAGTAVRYFKSFGALKKTLGPAGEGMVYHHIVEQSQLGRFGSHAIHNTENVIPVPAEVNQAISAYYSSKQQFTGDLTVRQWLSNQPYEAARDFGVAVLRQYGIDVL